MHTGCLSGNTARARDTLKMSQYQHGRPRCGCRRPWVFRIPFAGRIQAYSLKILFRIAVLEDSCVVIVEAAFCFVWAGNTYCAPLVAGKQSAPSLGRGDTGTRLPARRLWELNRTNAWMAMDGIATTITTAHGERRRRGPIRRRLSGCWFFHETTVTGWRDGTTASGISTSDAKRQRASVLVASATI